jgi:CDP-paratose 2-epimerase
VFNIGGGVPNTASVIEVIDLIAELVGERPEITWEEWRVADQRYYVSDTSAFTKRTGWRPRVSIENGLLSLYEWVSDERDSKQPLLASAGN